MFALPFAAVQGLCEWKYQWGHAEFLARRLEEYQCTLRMMCGWVVLSVQGNQLTQDLELLMQVMDSRLQSLATLYSDFHYQGSTEETNTTQNSWLFTLERSGNAGTPIRYKIRQEQIHGLREALWFRWVDIARMLGMSPGTLTQRMQEFGLPLGQQHNPSNLSDTDLDNIVRHILSVTSLWILRSTPPSKYPMLLLVHVDSPGPTTQLDHYLETLMVSFFLTAKAGVHWR